MAQPDKGRPISVVCGRRHRATRTCFADLVAGQTCRELLPTGFCLSPVWPDPEVVRSGDMVALLDPVPFDGGGSGRRIIRAMVDRWNRDPDSPARVVDELGIDREVLLDSWWTPNQPRGSGEPPILTVEDAAAMEPQLREILHEARNRRVDTRAQLKLAQANMTVREDERPTRRGKRAVWDLPWVLYDDAGDCHESPGLSFFMEGKRDRRRHMDWMRRNHYAYYKILLRNIHENRGPSEIAQLEEISANYARVKLHRARELLRARVVACAIADAKRAARAQA